MRHFLLGLALLAAGCGRTSVAPVSGRVTLDGKPLAGATIIFQPESEEMNPGPGSHGTTDAAGQYTLHLTTGDVKGAVVGRHRVSITAYEGGDEVPSSAPSSVFRKPLVPAEYNADTKLRFEVPAAGTTAADFELKGTP